MADNYLENKFEELGKERKVVVKRTTASLDSLLHKTRSCRGYDKSVSVSAETLSKIVSVNQLIASARNQQSLRFSLVTKENGGDKLAGLLTMGAALPEEALPKKGTEAEAFIVICSVKEENRYVDMDLGISLQSMALKSTELGLSSCVICAFNPALLQAKLALPYKPLAVLAVGKGIENIYLKPISYGESQAYYRKDGNHYVPKLKLEDLILK